jgi:hypothetical protein
MHRRLKAALTLASRRPQPRLGFAQQVVRLAVTSIFSLTVQAKNGLVPDVREPDSPAPLPVYPLSRPGHRRPSASISLPVQTMTWLARLRVS